MLLRQEPQSRDQAQACKDRHGRVHFREDVAIWTRPQDTLHQGRLCSHIRGLSLAMLSSCFCTLSWCSLSSMHIHVPHMHSALKFDTILVTAGPQHKTTPYDMTSRLSGCIGSAPAQRRRHADLHSRGKMEGASLWGM